MSGTGLIKLKSCQGTNILRKENPTKKGRQKVSLTFSTTFFLNPMLIQEKKICGKL